MRHVPLYLHGALETLAAPAFMVAPFLLGFSVAAGVISVALGALLFGIAFSTFGDRSTVPLSSHAAVDYAFALMTVLAGLVIGLVQRDLAATYFMVGIGIAHAALTASTRFSVPAGA